MTIPEGYTVARYAETLSRRRLADPRMFEQECHGDARRFLGFSVPRASMEGYLLPDTYKLQGRMSKTEIIEAMAANFKRRVERECGAIRTSGHSLDQTIIIASLIEREARVPGDRDKIAAVIYNRLQRTCRCKSTRRFCTRCGRTRRTFPFAIPASTAPTTRTGGAACRPAHCNPGVACIEAALHPASVPYLYYVAQPGGSHYFSTTYQEHKQHGRTTPALPRGEYRRMSASHSVNSKPGTQAPGTPVPARGVRGLCPRYVAPSLEAITPALLARLGIRAVILDLDNTLVTWHGEEIAAEVETWVRALRAARIEICIASNTHRPGRLRRLAERLEVRYATGVARAAPGRIAARARRDGRARRRRRSSAIRC